MVTLRRYRDLIKAECDKALLDNAGIPAFLAGENNAVNYGRFLSEIQLQVDDPDVDRARQVLTERAPLPDDFVAPEPPPGTPVETEPAPGSNKITWIIVGLLFVAGLVYFGTHPPTWPRWVTQDRNHDGHPDAWYRYVGRQLTETRFDQNFDGRIDLWYFYKDGVHVRSEGDANFDGRLDYWWTFTNGIAATSDADTDYDGTPDVHCVYRNGNLAACDWTDEQGRVFRHEIYRHGDRYQELLDENGDGWFDKRLTYDSRNRLVQTEAIHEAVPSRQIETDRLTNPAPVRPIPAVR